MYVTTSAPNRAHSSTRPQRKQTHRTVCYYSTARGRPPATRFTPRLKDFTRSLRRDTPAKRALDMYRRFHQDLCWLPLVAPTDVTS
jgi:hypothetical protein